MKKPPILCRGDKVAIIATAKKISQAEVHVAINQLSAWGLEVILGSHIFGDEHQFAGSVAQRCADLQWALDNPELKAIVCARGGYGTVQLIDHIDFKHFQNNPKWLIGYSDITVLHNHINQNFDVQSLHATMPINFESNTDAALESLQKALFGDSLSYEFARHPLNLDGACAAQVVGGNLSIIYSLTGTRSQVDTNGKILFIEDLNEYLYHVDRMLMNLERARILQDLAGLVVGGMTGMQDHTIPYGQNAQEIISSIVSKYNYPVCFDFPAGHIEDNRTLIMGANAQLEVGGQCKLSFT